MQARRNWEMAETEYPAIRRALDMTHEQMDDEQLEDYLADVMPDTSAEDMEDFMRSLQRFGRQVAPIAQRALPGIIQGAAQGGMVAGPWGALAGALGGGAASLLSGGGQAQPGARPAQAQAPQQAPTAAPATTRPPTAGGTPNMAPIQQLLALLARPETMQALSALLMSSQGRSTVAVGNRSVPAAAFANAISEIAAEVADNASYSPADHLSDYLVDAAGNLRGDVVNPAERARLLLNDISQQATEEFMDTEDFDDNTDIDDDWEDEYEFDALDDYEQVLAGEAWL